MKKNSPERLAFLARVVEKEAHHLLVTDSRVFARPLDAATIKALDPEDAFAERIDAFVTRFGRLQDNIGDKLLPTLLAAMGERIGPAIDNLDKAERFGWIDSADNWLAIRQLRNKMVHEYIEDPVILADALNTGHRFVPEMRQVVQCLLKEIRDHHLQGDSSGG